MRRPSATAPSGRLAPRPLAAPGGAIDAAAVPPSVHGLHHVALKARQPGRLAEFYRDALGLEEVARHVDDSGLRSVWLRVGEGLLMLERSDTPGDVPPFFADPPGLHLLALRIAPDERAAWIARLARRGVPPRAETAHSVFFTDPEGHRFALSHWPETG